jgi:peptidyl-prolyl cis-trans isomerase C
VIITRTKERPMFYRPHAMTLVSCAVLLFVSTGAHAQKKAGDATAATVNGQAISALSLQSYQRSFAPGQNVAPEPALDQLVGIELLAQEGKKKGLEKSPEVVADLENQRRNIVARAMMRNYLDANPVTDAQIRQAYDQRVATLPKQEYKLAHILTPTADAANAAIADLTKGKAFAAVARERSTDSNNKDNGGSLPWLNPNQMPPPVRDAVAGLKKSEYTKAPVQSELGWHVLLLEDTRAVTPPAFDAVKDQLKSSLENDRIGQYVAELKKSAKIVIK